MTWAHTKASRTQRGYGRAHQQARARLLPGAYGTACVRCGRTMHHGQALHLDHNATRTAYLGFAHASCNRVAGAREGNRRSHQAKAMPTSRAW